MSGNSQRDEHHDEAEAGYYRDLLMNEPGNPDHTGRWVGVDKPVIKHISEKDLISIDNQLMDIPF